LQTIHHDALAAVTGQSGKGIVVDCLQAGAMDFVVKPLEREAFLKKLDRFLG